MTITVESICYSTMDDFQNGNIECKNMSQAKCELKLVILFECETCLSLKWSENTQDTC